MTGDRQLEKGPLQSPAPANPSTSKRIPSMPKPANKSILAAKPPVRLVERPWGSFKQFARNEECTVSLMTVQPGQQLSLQSHCGRAELWIVLDDGAVVWVGDESRERSAGDEIWIPANAKHRLGCPGPRPVRVLEVAFGNWQQDDITRFADQYSRTSGT
jgi:mannose-1-phosphate guanylyltransferase/mannose-6-phosphate isomerase